MVSRMGNALGIFLAIAVAGVVYLVLVIALRAISRDDLALMPKGDKLADCCACNKQTEPWAQKTTVPRCLSTKNQKSLDKEAKLW